MEDMYAPVVNRDVSQDQLSSSDRDLRNQFAGAICDRVREWDDVVLPSGSEQMVDDSILPQCFLKI